MNTLELNRIALNRVEKEFKKRGYSISLPGASNSCFNFTAVSPSDTFMKVKLRCLRYYNNIFIQKDKFDVTDQHLYLAIVYMPFEDDLAIYLIPASAWKTGEYPFICRKSKKTGREEKNELGINFCPKSIAYLNEYKF